MVRDVKEAVAGVLVIVTGAAFLVASVRYGLGTLTSMQAGLLPAIAGAANILFGLGILWRALRLPPSQEDPHDGVHWRPFVAVCAGIAGFCLVVDRFGFVPAVAVAVVLSALGDRTSRALGTAGLLVVLAACTWIVFSVGLGVPVPAFRM